MNLCAHDHYCSEDTIANKTKFTSLYTLFIGEGIGNICNIIEVKYIFRGQE